MDEETKAKLRGKQEEMMKIIEAFNELEKNKDWITLKELLFKPSLEAIERQMKNEATAAEIDTKKLYRLQGELAWVRQYMDIPSFVRTLSQQLENIKKQLLQ